MHTSSFFACPPLTVRSALCVVALAGLGACQAPPTMSGPSAGAAAGSAIAVNSPRLGLSDTAVIYINPCVESPAGVCSIPITAIAPANGTGNVCDVAVASGVSLARSTVTLRWVLQPTSGDFEFRFRSAIPPGDKPGFGIRLRDNDSYQPEGVPPGANPMKPIWQPQTAQPQLVEMARTVRQWPPRMSAYDVYLEYKPKGISRDWTACRTWDPIIVNRD